MQPYTKSATLSIPPKQLPLFEEKIIKYYNKKSRKYQEGIAGSRLKPKELVTG
jgi:hypothetical protein